MSAPRGTCAECLKRRKLVKFRETSPDGRRRWVCRPCSDRLLEAEVEWLGQVDRGIRRWREAV